VFSNRASRLTLVVALFLLPPSVGASNRPLPNHERVGAVAVFPTENLAGVAIPSAEVRESLIDRFTAEGITVLGDDALEAFMASHRVRYGAGIDSVTAEQLRSETGVDGVVVATVELSSEAAPPKAALFARLISITGTPVVTWADDAGIAGDEAPGLFELGLVNDYGIVLKRALDRVGQSLTAYLRTGQVGKDVECASKFRPKAYHRSLTLEPGRAHTVAVVPFFNLSERRGAGEIMALHFIRHLSAFSDFSVVDAGVARQPLLDARIIMDSGLSISDADTVAALIQAEFVLAGRVIRYDDYEGPGGQNGVEFSTALIEKKTRKVVWSSDSYNAGTDGIGFFGRGSTKTAHAMATQMVRLTAELMAGRRH
jgi:TolB-like protein